MESTYHVSYNVISLGRSSSLLSRGRKPITHTVRCPVFLANTVGYFISSVTHSWTLHHYGLRCILANSCALF